MSFYNSMTPVKGSVGIPKSVNLIEQPDLGSHSFLGQPVFFLLSRFNTIYNINFLFPKTLCGCCINYFFLTYDKEMLQLTIKYAETPVFFSNGNVEAKRNYYYFLDSYNKLNS